LEQKFDQANFYLAMLKVHDGSIARPAYLDHWEAVRRGIGQSNHAV